MAHKIRRAEFTTWINDKYATIVYTHCMETGAQTVTLNGSTIVQRATFIGGRERFWVYGAKTEIYIRSHNDGQHEYTLKVDGKTVQTLRDGLYAWKVNIDGTEYDIRLNMHRMEVRVNDEIVPIDPRFHEETDETITPFKIMGKIPCQLETYKDSEKDGMAFQLYVRGKRVPPVR